MDGLASIGRAFATPQFVITVIIAVGVIIGGIVLMTTAPQQPKLPPGFPQPPVPQQSTTGRIAGGAAMVVFGFIMIFAGWLKRKYIRSNPNVAALFGALDVESMLKTAIN